MFLTKEQVRKLSDDQVLEMAKGMGPAIIGPHLFERAEKVQRVNPTGSLGPSIIGVDATKLEEQADDDLQDYGDTGDGLDADDFEEEPEDADEEAAEEAARVAREAEDLAALKEEDRRLEKELADELKAELERPPEPTFAPAPVKPKPKGKGKKGK